MSQRLRAPAGLGANHGLWPPVTLAVALRIGLMVAGYCRTGTRIMTQGDTASYLIPARALLHGSFAALGAPEIDRTPGYPLFLMLSGMSLDNVLLSVTCQIAISVASLVLVGRIAARTFPNGDAAVWAAWLYAVEPIGTLSTVRLMPETLFVFLLLCILDRLLAYLKEPKIAPVVCGGIFLAAATFVRPVSYYLVFPLAVALAVLDCRRQLRWWKAPAFLLLATLPWLAAWQLRNRIETGYGGFSSIVEKNLYFYQSAEVTAELHRRTLAEEQEELGYPDEASYAAWHPEQAHWTTAERLAYMRAASLNVIAEHRLLYLRTHFRGVAVVAFTPCATELLQLLRAYPDSRSMPSRILNEGMAHSLLRVFAANPATAWTMLALELPLLFLYAMALLGVLRGQGDRRAMLLLTGVALYFLLISGGAQAVGRYRVPVMPELCVLAAGGAASFRKYKGGTVWTGSAGGSALRN